MKKFLVLYIAPVEEFQKMMANSTPEDHKESMDEWGKWMQEHGKDLVDMGAPLGKTKRVTASGVLDVKNDLGGYSIVQADTHEDAAQIFEGHLHLQIPGATIEVMECMPMPEM